MKDEDCGCCDRHHAGLVPVDLVRAELLEKLAPVAGTSTIPIATSPGRILAESIRAPLPLPPRDNSAMDGYALGPAGAERSYFVRNRIVAGETGDGRALAAGEAVRIFTGAPVPPGAVAVAKQEDVTRDGNRFELAATPEPGQNIRRGGEDVRQGEDLISAGTRLDPRHVAILAASGATQISVKRPVRIALFSSGLELCEPGASLGPAAIHDSNRWMLRSLLAGSGVALHDLGILPDNRDAIAVALDDASHDVDLLIGTGGVSVGEEDHVFAALERIGAHPQQRKMAVKPGKPLVFGQSHGALVLGLPGNPVSALVSFLLLARPCIAALSGAVSHLPPPEPAPAVADFSWRHQGTRAEYFPARIVGFADDGRPILDKLGRGGSALLRPLIEADGLAYVAADRAAVSPGDRLDWHPFSTGFAL